MSSNATPSPFRIRRDDVEVLGQGVRVYGSGGGGDPGIACASLARLLTADAEVQVVPPASLAADARVVPFGFVGATSLLSERPPSGAELLDIWSGIDAVPDALVPMEIGGFNGVAAVWAAAALGVPLVDADLMGRALPELQQLLPVAHGWTPCPAVVGDVHGRQLVLDRMTPAMLEMIVRAALTPMGGWAVLACQPLTTELVTGACHPGSVTRALAFGRDVHRLRDGAPIDQLPALDGMPLGEGRVVEITRGAPRTGRRMPVTTVVVDLSDPPGGVLRLEAESEWLAAVVDGEPAATVPELILVWDVDSREVLAVETLRRGRNVRVTALPGAVGWWHPDALGYVEPAAFALDIPACRTTVPAE
ncbi:MAG: DUF917 family protein [Streptosporangiales bacterium]|nr:DUF917 family protein [Streptosporangiales bacterium]